MHISDEFVLVKVYGGLQNSDLWPNGGAGGDAPFHLLTLVGEGDDGELGCLLIRWHGSKVRWTGEAAERRVARLVGRLGMMKEEVRTPRWATTSAGLILISPCQVKTLSSHHTMGEDNLQHQEVIARAHQA